MFKRTPILVNSNSALVQNGGDIGDMGITTRPVGTVTPQFQITATQKKDGLWYARVQLNRQAAEGQNKAAYLAPGDYISGKGEWAGGAIGAYNAHWCPGGQITSRVDQVVSNLSRLAETEHCTDILRAYAITVKAAEKAIQHGVTQSPIGPRRKRQDIMKRAREVITTGLHNRLTKVFTDAIQINAMVNHYRFQTDLLALFLGTCDLSQNRDLAGHHFFGFGPRIQRNALSAMIWGQIVGDIRPIIRGPQFQVPGTATNVLIQL